MMNGSAIESIRSATGDRRVVGPVLEQDRELVTPEAADGVAAARAFAQPLGDPEQHLVAGLVAEGVVDVLEVVEVEHQDGDAGRNA